MTSDYEDRDFTDETPPWEQPFSDEAAAVLRSQTEALYAVPEGRPDEDGLVTLPAVVLADAIVFPHLVAPLIVPGEENVAAVRAAVEDGTTLAVFLLSDLNKDAPTWADVFPVGVEAAAGFPYAMPNEAHAVLMQGRRRVELVDIVQTSPYPLVRVRLAEAPEPDDAESRAQMKAALRTFERFVELNDALPEETYLYALNADQMGWLADLMAMALSPEHPFLLEVLGTADPTVRLQRVLKEMQQEVARLELEPQDFPAALEKRADIVAALRGAGYTFVTLDLAGFRSGSFNRARKME